VKDNSADGFFKHWEAELGRVKKELHDLGPASSFASYAKCSQEAYNSLVTNTIGKPPTENGGIMGLHGMKIFIVDDLPDGINFRVFSAKGEVLHEG
jgi:hypothetical protein